MNSSFSPNPESSSEIAAWAHKLNCSWIVHGGLDRHADEYLRHLAATDTERLARSCRRARLMLQAREPAEDPKAWFYSGVFSLATPEEVERFIGQHWMTRAAVSSTPVADPLGISKAAIEKLRRIRVALSRLVD